MKKYGDWIYCDYCLYNVKNRNIVYLDGFDAFKINKEFFTSSEFQKMLSKSIMPSRHKAKFNQILALEVTDKCNYACSIALKEKVVKIQMFCLLILLVGELMLYLAEVS